MFEVLVGNPDALLERRSKKQCPRPSLQDNENGKGLREELVGIIVWTLVLVASFSAISLSQYMILRQLNAAVSFD